MLKIKFEKLALINISQIKLYYNSKKENFGDKFIEDLISDLEKLKSFPNLGSVYVENIRKLIFNKNYSIYYIVTETEIIVIKLINSKQDL
jgi:plasmid stabilization system protein ParE